MSHGAAPSDLVFTCKNPCLQPLLPFTYCTGLHKYSSNSIIFYSYISNLSLSTLNI